MKELVENWRIFIKVWKADSRNLRPGEMIIKPDLYDFMAWLAENYPLNDSL